MTETERKREPFVDPQKKKKKTSHDFSKYFRFLFVDLDTHPYMNGCRMDEIQLNQNSIAN